MGAHPYWYVEPYEGDPARALEKLRQREFQAGRYNPVMPFIDFPITAASPRPGARHATIAEALEASGADGTRSILDIAQISAEPEFCAARPLPDEVLEDLYGTTQPSRAQVEPEMAFLEDVERGQAVYILLYDQGKPTEILFAGYSFD